MAAGKVKPALLLKLLAFQRNEVTGALIYGRLARAARRGRNGATLAHIARDEARHARQLKEYTGTIVAPRRWQAGFYYWVSRLFGVTFGVKLMETQEAKDEAAYREASRTIPALAAIARDEARHEHVLIGLIEEGHLTHVGSIVLGLNDALVEITGTLAGLTLAIHNPHIIAAIGAIVGIAGAFSMAGSEYLSKKSEGDSGLALGASLYTGVAYIVTVVCLVSPYAIFSSGFAALALMLVLAVLIIMVFNYYTAVAQGLSFRERFTEMVVVSMGVSLLSFGVGYIVRSAFGIEI